MKKRLLFLLLSTILLSACEKALISKGHADDPRGNFESLWQTVNDKYSYFQLKGIHWDSVYQHYSPQIGSNTSDEELFRVLDSMLFDLRDGHVNLVAPFNLSRNWQWYLDHPENFDYSVIQRHYLGPDHRIAGGLAYQMIDSVGYIYYGSFASAMSTANLNAVMDFMQPAKGLIVDVRHNGGGVSNRAFQLASRLVDRERMVLQTQEKTGPGPGEFGRSLNHSVGPGNNSNFSGPVVVLINRRSYSATNTFAAIMRQFPEKIYLMGDQTGGGGGTPIDYELPKGWRYRFSATRSRANINGEMRDIELGVPPYEYVNTDSLRLLEGTDDILEAALQRLR